MVRSMSSIESRVRRDSEEFAANAVAAASALRELQERLALVRQGGSAAARERHRARGKLLVRDRIRLLLDPGTPFLELSPLAAWDMYGGEVPAAGIVSGVGRVSGRECLIVANDATVK